MASARRKLLVVSIIIRDETPSGKEIGSFVLEDAPSTITLRDLIRLRVREEVVRFNASPQERFNGLVRPLEAEELLNGYQVKPGKRIDWEKQAEAAVEAFGHNGFFVLVGDRQVEDLDQLLDLSEASDVSFVKLVPLAGG